MSQSPYSADVAEQAYIDDFGDPIRTSLAAVFSLVFSLICCIPGFGVIGIILGVVALVLISGAGGKLGGKGLAIAGIIVGIAVSAIWAAISFGGLEAYTYYKNSMAPQVESFITTAKSGDYDASRGVLSSGAGGDLSDERIAEFFAAAETQYGRIDNIQPGLGDLIESFGRVRSQSTGGSFDPNDPTAVPFPLYFDSGPAPLWITFDEDTLGTPNPEISDALLVLSDGRSCITLREDGPATNIAAALGLEIIALEDVGQAATPPDDATPEDGDAPPDASESPAPSAV